MQRDSEDDERASGHHGSLSAAGGPDEGDFGRARAYSVSVSHRAEDIAVAIKREVGSKLKCLGCAISGNAISLLTSAFLFATITTVQYIYAVKANSLALQADCVSMGVDSLAFLGNLFAECAPRNEQKRRFELTMSGISHFLLLGFTVKFMLDGIESLQGGDDDDVDGRVVMAFAIGGLLFDVISLLVYACVGQRDKQRKKDQARLLAADNEMAVPLTTPTTHADELTCGINTNMCAALLHVLSDLGRSSTTLIESVVLLYAPSIPGNKADGVSTLIVCSVIIVGCVSAIFVWMREVYVYVTRPVVGAIAVNQDIYGQIGE